MCQKGGNARIRATPSLEGLLPNWVTGEGEKRYESSQKGGSSVKGLYPHRFGKVSGYTISIEGGQKEEKTARTQPERGGGGQKRWH